MMLAGRMPRLAFPTRSFTPLERARVALAALTPADRAKLCELVGLVDVRARAKAREGDR